MTKHTQFYLEAKPDDGEGKVNIELPNLYRLDKDFNIKNRHVVTDRETEMNHGQKIKVKQVISGDPTTYKIKLDDYIVGISNVTVSRTVQLPQPSLAGNGKIYVIKDMSGSAASTTITISPFNTELIDHDTSSGIGTNYGVKKYFTDGTNWFSW